MEYTPGLWLFILSACILAALFGYSWQFRKNETGREFLFLIGCALVWVVGFIFETALTTLPAKLAAIYPQFLAIALLPAAWLQLAFSYTGLLPPRVFRVLYFTPAAITTLVLWTNSLHHWFYGVPRLIYDQMPFPVLDLDYQFWFYNVHAPLSYLYTVAAVAVLLYGMRKLDGIFKTQSRLLLLAILLPVVTDGLYVLGLTPVAHYNFTTAVFSLSGLILVWTLFRFRFLDLLPLARDTVIDDLIDSVVIFDHHQRIAYVNQTAQKNLDIPPEFSGESIETLKKHKYLSAIAPLLQSGPVSTDVEINAPQKQYLDLRTAPVKNHNGLRIGWVALARDITERVELFKQVQNLSNLDGLTGISNRRCFYQQSEREVLRVKRSGKSHLSALMIDLDDFKIINDYYGHAAGDELLLAVTRAVQNVLRQYDLFGRIGGEEFAILLIDASLPEAFAIANRIRQTIAEVQVALSEGSISVTASIGISTTQDLPGDNLSLEKLLALADQAMYEAKHAGRNQVKVFET